MTDKQKEALKFYNSPEGGMGQIYPKDPDPALRWSAISSRCFKFQMLTEPERTRPLFQGYFSQNERGSYTVSYARHPDKVVEGFAKMFFIEGRGFPSQFIAGRDGLITRLKESLPKKSASARPPFQPEGTLVEKKF